MKPTPPVTSTCTYRTLVRVLEDDFGLEGKDIEFTCRNPMVDGSINVFLSVFEGNSKAVETVVLDVDIDIFVFIATGDSSDERRRDRLRFAIP